jgi:methionyl-tRNA synthetase
MQENYFFALSKYQSQLEELLGGDSEFVQPPSRKNEVLGWVKQGVRDFSISRTAVPWGIPMAQDPHHTVYVWFDALNGEGPCAAAQRWQAPVDANPFGVPGSLHNQGVLVVGTWRP